MQRVIVHSRLMLWRRAESATADDLALAQDLLDTLEAHRAGCAGMAANMIGRNKRIIAFFDDRGHAVAMLNPEITRREVAYQTEEGCLSLDGLRSTTRYRTIDVTWQDGELRTQSGTFTGFVAQVIQHEVDHCDGIII